MKLRIILTIFMFPLTAGIIGCGIESLESDDSIPAYELLFGNYQLGEDVQVYGIISEIGYRSDTLGIPFSTIAYIGGKPYVELDGIGSATVHCLFSDSERIELMTLFVGQFVTISGRVSRGNVYGSVILEDCYVVR